jgi:hypothetical protein
MVTRPGVHRARVAIDGRRAGSPVELPVAEGEGADARKRLVVALHALETTCCARKKDGGRCPADVGVGRRWMDVHRGAVERVQ